MLTGVFILAGCGWNGEARLPDTAGLLPPLARVPLPGSDHAPSGRVVWVSSTEVTVGQFARFLQEEPVAMRPELGCGAFTVREGLPNPARGYSRRPMACLTRDEAQAFCAWAGRKLGAVVRLLTREEWQWAARGGVRGGSFPWGWGDPQGRARYRSAEPVVVGSFSPNAYGLFDMGGNVAEWTSSEEGEDGVACGGSWAERSEKRLHPGVSFRLPQGYSDLDVGFRVVVEPQPAQD